MMEENKNEEKRNKLASRLFVEQGREEEEKDFLKEESLDPNKGLHLAMQEAEISREEFVPKETQKEIPRKEPSLENKEVMELLTSLMNTQAEHGKFLKEQEFFYQELQKTLKNLDKTLNMEENAEIVYTIIKRTQSLLEKHQESLESIDIRFTEGMNASFKGVKEIFQEYIACIHAAHQKVLDFSKTTNEFLEKEKEVVTPKVEKKERKGFSFNFMKDLIKLGILLVIGIFLGRFLQLGSSL